ncbi:conserved hypothetical protein [Vibrio chagasii]|uniref:hypothetical protein n=1 Tax=Vibrio crassostreae TaxID=246167 RepID=UPI0010432272|nr:hypothetical protein [Vibrio crassostreae]CAH7221705.1 conserved hypothetical protein [Vibrio chagasii]TCN95752.1 hypothetical protein EDB51_11769 [Vibrio crassostreae]CAK2752800.1 conserved hypothetical protein [Vibrio crassostreae]CAK3364516.1 conserved hypothetical protein [Vibrio crassostreae]CAK3762345.1 conserved hypothetical protein [Vibrio crassostreae]
MVAQQVLTLLDKQKLELKEDQLLVELVEPMSQAQLEEGLKFAGYKSPLRALRNKTQIKVGTTHWSEGQFIYTNEESIFDVCDTQAKVPDNLLYFDESNSKLFEFSSDVDFYKKLSLFVGLRKLLTDLSDHCVPNEQVVFLIKNEGGGVKHEVSITLEYEELVKAYSDGVDLDKSLKLLLKLQQAINLDDEQDKERKNCMRSAFDVLIQGLSNESDIFPYCLANIIKFYKTYTEHHTMYLSDFTINKVIQEINTKDLEYTGKINDITSSVQTKALAIPGAMIAISAVMKVDSISSAVGVVVALFLTCLVIDKSLNIYQASFAHLDKQINNVFSRYQVLSQKSEVRCEAKNTEQALNVLIGKGKSGLYFVRLVIWGVWLFSLFFVWYKLEPLEANNLEEQATKIEQTVPKNLTKEDEKLTLEAVPAEAGLKLESLSSEK